MQRDETVHSKPYRWHFIGPKWGPMEEVLRAIERERQCYSEAPSDTSLAWAVLRHLESNPLGLLLWAADVVAGHARSMEDLRKRVRDHDPAQVERIRRNSKEIIERYEREDQEGRRPVTMSSDDFLKTFRLTDEEQESCALEALTKDRERYRLIAHDSEMTEDEQRVYHDKWQEFLSDAANYLGPLSEQLRAYRPSAHAHSLVGWDRIVEDGYEVAMRGFCNCGESWAGHCLAEVHAAHDEHLERIRDERHK